MYQGYQGVSPGRKKTPLDQLLMNPQANMSLAMPQVAGQDAGVGVAPIAPIGQPSGSEREIANLLMQRANSRQPTGIVDGLASLGEAFLARKAINKADKVDQDYASAQAAQQKSIADLLMQSGDYTPEQKALIASGAPGVREMMMERAFAAPPENKVVNDRLVDPRTGEVIGDYSDPLTYTEGTYVQGDDGQFNHLAKTPTPVDPNKLAIEQQRADAATLSAEASMARAGQQRNGITIGPDGTVRIGGTANQTLTGPSDPESNYIQASTALASSQETHQTMMSSIDKALDQVGILTAGPGALLSSVPGTPARDMQATLDTVRANLGFEKLQEMRENSPTGGALGQVTERELAFLQAVRGSLDSMQSPQQLRETLVDIRASLERLQENREKAFTQRYQVGAPGTPRTVFDPAAVAEGDLSALSDEDLDAAIEALGGGG